MKTTHPKKVFLPFGISAIERLMFTKHMAVMLASGLGLGESLEILKEQYKGPIAAFVSHMYDLASSGYAFADALSLYPRLFSPLYRSVVRGGEISGTLSFAMRQLAIQMKKDYEIQKRLQQAAMYPSVVLVATVTVGFVLSIVVLPRIVPLFVRLDVHLPWSTRFLLWWTDLFKARGGILILATILIVFFLVWLLKRPVAERYWHPVLIDLPWVGPLVRKVNMAHFHRALGTLLESGMPIADSIHTTAQTLQNVAYRKSLEHCLLLVQQGDTVAQSLSRFPRLWDTITVRMIAVGENTGRLKETMQYLAAFYEDETDADIKFLINALEPFLLLVIGVVFGGVALAIISPIYQIAGAIR